MLWPEVPWLKCSRLCSWGQGCQKPGGGKWEPYQRKRNQKDLVILKELLEAGKIVPVIDRRYLLSEVPEALRYLGEGHARGKIVITMEHNSKT